MLRRRPPVTYLAQIRYNAQHPGLQKNLPATFKYDVWGPRKTWIKEVPVPFEDENKTLWGPQRQLVYNKKKKKMEIQIVENSPFQEKVALFQGRVSRVFNPFSKKDMIERKYRRLLWKYQNYYYVSNLPYNAEKLQFFHNEVGPIVTSAHIFIDKMDCAIQYERQGRYEGKLEWIEDLRVMDIQDPRELKITAIDARFSNLGYEGLQNLRVCKELKYLNCSYAPKFDNHCMTRLHMVSETLEYLDLSGSSVSIKGLGYLRLLENLKWLNLSDLPEEPEIEKYLPYIQEILPPDCVVIVNSQSDTEELKRLTDGGKSSFENLTGKTSEDIRKLFKLPEAGFMTGTTWLSGRLRRKRLQKIFNAPKTTRQMKQTIYKKAAERLPPLM